MQNRQEKSLLIFKIWVAVLEVSVPGLSQKLIWCFSSFLDPNEAKCSV